MSDKLISEIQLHFRKLHKEVAKDSSPWPAFVAKIRGVLGGTRAAPEKLRADGIASFYSEAGQNVLIGESPARATSIIGRDLTQVAKGNAPNVAKALIKWFWVRHRPEFEEFLQAFGFTQFDQSDSGVNYDAFLCWSGDYALEFVSCIRDFFGSFPQGIAAFLSSRDIENSSLWRGILNDSLAKSAKGLLIATQDIIDSPYIEFEYGALGAKDKAPQVFLLDAPESLLPVPFSARQYNHYSFDKLRAWIESVFDDIERRRGIHIEAEPTQFSELEEKLEAIRQRYQSRHVSSANHRWRHYGRPVMIGKQKDSPFDLQQLIHVAQRRLVLVAQNHRFMTSLDADERYAHWPVVEDALLRGVDIDIVSMHKEVAPTGYDPAEVPSAYELWSLYMKANDFPGHCDECWVSLKRWAELFTKLRTQRKKTGVLRIYGSYFTPLTISLVDPDDEHGFLVLSPRINLESNDARPQFILRKAHEEVAFSYYAEATLNSLNNAGWKKMF